MNGDQLNLNDYIRHPQQQGTCFMMDQHFEKQIISCNLVHTDPDGIDFHGYLAGENLHVHPFASISRSSTVTSRLKSFIVPS